MHVDDAQACALNPKDALGRPITPSEEMRSSVQAALWPGCDVSVLDAVMSRRFAAAQQKPFVSKIPGTEFL